MLKPGEHGTRAYVGLGANLGDREATLRSAVAKLARVPGVQVLAVSSLLENPAVGGPPDSPPFINAAAAVESSLDARTLLGQLLRIESELGRQRHEKNDPRTIDLDLLLFNRAVIDAEGLKVPHPEMHHRRFVLQPLSEIAPDAIHPVLRATVVELLGRLRA